MLRGRQFKLLRLYKNIKLGTLAERLNIPENLVIMYEYEIKPIPDDLYKAWIDIISSL